VPEKGRTTYRAPGVAEEGDLTVLRIPTEN
jgi:hypothetical protein